MNNNKNNENNNNKNFINNNFINHNNNNNLISDSQEFQNLKTAQNQLLDFSIEDTGVGMDSEL